MTQAPVRPVSTPQPSGSGGPHGLGAKPRPGRGRISAYVALTKPRIIELLLVTTLPSMVLAAKGLPDVWVAIVTMVGGTLAAGSANALNCYIDRDIDAIMRRTGRRPLARHEVSPNGALIFGLLLGAASVLAIGLVTNWLAGALTFVAIAFYIGVYTMVLKRRTAQNIVWGGIAGCMPVLIGWSAVTGSMAAAPFALFLVVFFWTPPHTWALATGWVYGALAGAAGAVLIAGAHRLLHQTRRGEAGKPMQFFHLSNSYLAFVFVAVAVDTFVR